MSKPLKKNELGYLGEDFQYKLVHEFTENSSFFEDLHSIVNQNMFTDPMLKIYVGVMKDYLSKYGTVQDMVQFALYSLKKHIMKLREIVFQQ